MSERTKQLLKTGLKFGLSAAALTIVFRSIDWIQVESIFLELKLIWLVPAIVFFAISKVFSTLRLGVYFAAIGVAISTLYNLRLTWIGMFYNFFLPGGIGGDAYKVYLLNGQYNVKAKLLGAGVLLDRINGVVALACLAGIGYCSLPQEAFPNWLLPLVLIATVMAYPTYQVGVYWLFKSFTGIFWRTTPFSFLTQGSQVVSAYFILQSLGIDERILEYLVLFLISSIVAVLPFTIGGIGARELTFILGNDILGIDQTTAVAFSLIFFMITVLVSAVGGFLPAKKVDQSSSKDSSTSIT